MRSKYGKRGIPRVLRSKKDRTAPTMPAGAQTPIQTPAKPTQVR